MEAAVPAIHARTFAVLRIPISISLLMFSLRPEPRRGACRPLFAGLYRHAILLPISDHLRRFPGKLGPALQEGQQIIERSNSEDRQPELFCEFLDCRSRTPTPFHAVECNKDARGFGA